MNFQKLLSKPEGKTLEFKRDLSSLKPILKTLVAFANTAGGTIIIGRSDGGKITGVSDVLREEERLASVIADSIPPSLMPELEVRSYEGKPLLIATVPHWRGLFYLKAEGPEKGVYVRLGSTNRMAGDELLAELQRSLDGSTYDQMTHLPLRSCEQFVTADQLEVTIKKNPEAPGHGG
jgi:predicted HTH transcriptional regulator